MLRNGDNNLFIYYILVILSIVVVITWCLLLKDIKSYLNIKSAN